MSPAALDVVVVGSVNVDLVASVERMPAPGETVSALRAQRLVGGKGSNQAVAAARLGCSVAMVGIVGDDPDGELARRALADEGVDVDRLGVAVGELTGRAMVWVDADAQNSIVVIPGANALLTSDLVGEAGECIRRARVVLAQLETPLESVRAAARLARGIVVLNPAPAQVLPTDLLERVDVLVVNETEYEIVTARQLPASPRAVVEALRDLPLPCDVVVTLGSQGAVVRDGDEVEHIAAPDVAVVDTTGAGDCFVGAFASFLSDGGTPTAAARWAVHAASISVGAVGATTAMPDRAAVEASIARTTHSIPAGP
ncbi:ribokinase [Actinotalea sp. Marseille-Q4924]|uniref:ribokinase n=1 Tax=Actinotalea sp. Marseille-Q4924 TaxID=2866571 RepID=UPI001CE3B5D7|nr:ribokinase [Actinotalea sp. Marseille-Q4924]